MEGSGCQSGCEQRSDAFLKIIFIFFFGGGGRRVGGQGGCDRRSEVFVKIQKKKKILGGGRVGTGGPIRGWGGDGGSKVWGRWVMWGMGDVNKE